ncbi:WD repeat-containing protein 59 [Clonorchis sinensis]|uniref:WD repeat-containing protein 59 n=1 Tax=Clonorchis sinensis TaxID=79923 RepID=G7Y6N1_CLOSI|nr:WD repeat-containing protein 59 [Clonorchis sinensis]
MPLFQGQNAQWIAFQKKLLLLSLFVDDHVPLYGDTFDFATGYRICENAVDTIKTAMELCVLCLDQPSTAHRYPLNLKSDPTGLSWHPTEPSLLIVVKNIPEPYLTDQTADSNGRGSLPPSISDFNWSPLSAYELCSISQRGVLCVWDIRQPNSPRDKLRSVYSHNTKVYYSPSGSHILTLSEPTLWKDVGFNVWNAHNLQQPAPPLWKADPLSGAVSRPVQTEPAVKTMTWRIPTSLNSAYSRKLDEEDGNGLFRGDDLDGSYDPRAQIGLSPELVTWSEDQTIRRYPIQIYSAPVDSSFATGVYSKQSTASHVATHAPPLERSATDQRCSLAKRPLGSGRNKHTDVQTKLDETNSRFFTAKLHTSTPEPDGSQEENAYRILAQELSLLTPRVGQYKVEEIDMINRNAKLKLFFCRKLHYHHYTVCSVGADMRGRRPSADLEEIRDLDSLLIPPGDILPSMDNPARLEQQWKSPEQCKSATDLHDITRLDGQRQQPQQHAAHTPQLPQSQQQSITASLAPLNARDSKQLSNSGSSDSSIPVAGAVTISVSFPLDYPRSAPQFTILHHYPALPTELVSRLHEVLRTTASELVHTCRGCMEPCMRKAVDLLQNIPSNRLLTSVSRQLCPMVTSLITQPPYSNDVQRMSCGSPPVQSLKSLISDPEDRHLSQTPFPRTSGVHFSTRGLLVAFGLPLSLSSLRAQLRTTASVFTTDTSDWTPRSFKDYRSMMITCVDTPKVSIGATSTISGITVAKPLEELSGRTDYMITENDIFTDVEWAQSSFSLPPTESQTVVGQRASSRIRPPMGSFPVGTTQPWNNRNSSISSANKLTIKNVIFLDQSVTQLYDFSGWVVHKKLIRNYSLSTENVQNMCAHNYLVALNTGRKDIQHFWQYAVVLTASMTKSSFGTLPPLSVQPVGKLLFNEWLSHFLRLCDVQHLAMAILVLLGLENLYADTSSDQLARSSGDSKHHERANQRPFSSKKDQDGSYSCSDSSDPVFSPVAPEVSFNLDNSEDCTPVPEAPINRVASGTSLLHTQHNLLVDAYEQHWGFVASEELPCFAHYISVYADILYSMGSFLRHARLLRAWTDGLKTRWSGLISSSGHKECLSSGKQSRWPPNPMQSMLLPSCPVCGSSTSYSEVDGMEPPIRCHICSWSLNGSSSSSIVLDKSTILRCSVCRIQAKGLVFICPKCHHGGHMDHLFQWFSTRSNDGCSRQCPSINCACSCAFYFFQGNIETHFAT